MEDNADDPTKKVLDINKLHLTIFGRGCHSTIGYAERHSNIMKIGFGKVKLFGIHGPAYTDEGDGTHACGSKKEESYTGVIMHELLHTLGIFYDH